LLAGDAEDADMLLSRSEIAMYAAKRKLSGALRTTLRLIRPARRRCRC
jgi:hypothetical protein